MIEPTREELEQTLRNVAAHLAAAISLLERTPGAKKAAPSDRMFDQMLDDYKSSLERARDLYRPIEQTTASSLDRSDPFLESLREDYPEFDRWLDKCSEDNRTCFAVWDDDRLRALAILKPKTSKICTFKCERGLGKKLLRHVLTFFNQNGLTTVHATVLPEHIGTIRLFEKFGFTRQPGVGEEILLVRHEK